MFIGSLIIMNLIESNFDNESLVFTFGSILDEIMLIDLNEKYQYRE